MEVVIYDLQNYLKKNIFPSKTVLVFPPFNGFRRFLIHKLIEDNFSSAEIAAFSIGKDISRRIVVCYKGLVRTDHNKVTLGTPTQKPFRTNMIEGEEKARQKSSPSVPVYRPPAVRIAETRQRVAEMKTDTSKRSRVRRPDQQMYVPRPKRASFGNDQQRSRSSSQMSLEGDSCDRRKSSSRLDEVALENNGTINNTVDGQERLVPKTNHSSAKTSTVTKSPSIEDNYKTDDVSKINAQYTISSENLNTEVPAKNIFKNSEESNNLEIINQLPRKTQLDENIEPGTAAEIFVDFSNEHQKSICDRRIEDGYNDKFEDQVCMSSAIKTSVTNSTDNLEYSESVQICHEEPVHSNVSEAMETISLSSDSRDSTTTSSDTVDGCPTSSSQDENKRLEEMQTDVLDDCQKEIDPNTSRSQKHKLKRKNKHNKTIVTNDVLIISDSSSSSNDLNLKKTQQTSTKTNAEKSIKSEKEKVEKVSKSDKVLNPDEYDWESLYDDSGECLVPDLMEELTNSVGKVRIATADSDYRPYQSMEERSNDGECVIEIYDFPAEFKTTDLINIFAAYRNKNFQIKWVDDTHALGVFPSPLMADEVLACTLPFVKTRPLRLGIAESRNKARTLILPALPSAERPKTCTALARRLVSGALGLRLPTSTQDREKEKQLLKEAREKRRLEAKQRQDAWEGTLTSV